MRNGFSHGWISAATSEGDLIAPKCSYLQDAAILFVCTPEKLTQVHGVKVHTHSLSV